MKLSIKKMTSVIVFLLLYYVYLNSVRKIMIPMSGIIVPVILLMTVAVSFLQQNRSIVIRNKYDRMQCAFWIMIAIFILVNNTDLVTSFLENGMIQLYTMISFFLFAIKYNEWQKVWIKTTRVFVMIHALSTIIFFYNAQLYRRFVSFFFSENVSANLLRYYDKGWMSGLCTHFSSNGMILAIGLIVFFEYIRELRANRATLRILIGNYVCIILVLYALILSSKRSPLIASFIAIAITYILAEGKDVAKRLVLFIMICIVLYVLYVALVNNIPGLATIVNKFNALEEGEVGVLNGREHRWALAVEMFKNSPLWGQGYGSYEVFSANAGARTSAHNYYLSTLAELGIVGFVLFCGAFITGILSVVYLLRRAVKKGNKNRMILCLALEIQLFVIVYCMTATALMYYYILIPYFLACTVARCPLEETYCE